MKYQAFISYRHADNTVQGRQWATWLHQALETYEVPDDLVGQKNECGEIIPARIYPVFRDEEELPADADLASSIKQALEQTNVLVVLCSPQAVASTYVADEIDYFKKMGHSEHIIAAMLDGEPNASWDRGKQELGFTTTDECFPKPLQIKYSEQGQPTQEHAEPIAADFRINNDGIPEQGWTTPEAYKQHLTTNTVLDGNTIEQKVSDYQKQQKLMLLKIIAGILGIPLGELTQRDKEYQLVQERLRAKKLRRWVSALLILTILAIVAGGYAYLKQQEAERQTAEANNNYALVLNEKAIQAEKEGNIEYAKLYALHTQQNIKPHRNLKAYEKILYQYGNKSNLIYSSSNRHHQLAVNELAQSPSGHFLASAANKTIKIWDLQTGEYIQSLTGHSGLVTGVIFVNEKTLVSSSYDKTIIIWDLETGKPTNILRGHTDSIFSISLSSDGNTLASASRDGTARIWDIEQAKIIGELSLDGSFVFGVSFSPTEEELAISSGNTIKFWNYKTQTIRRTIESENTLSIRNISYSPNGKIIAGILFLDEKVILGPKAIITLWNAQSGEKLSDLIGQEGSIESVSFSKDSKFLASSSLTGVGESFNSVFLWDIAGTNAIVKKSFNYPSGAASVIFSKDNEQLFIGTYGYIHNLSLSEKEKYHYGNNNYAAENYLKISQDGRYLAYSSPNGFVNILDLVEGKLQHTSSKDYYGNTIRDIDLSPKNDMYAVIELGSKKGIIRLVDIQSGNQIKAWNTDWKFPTNVTFSPDGHYLAYQEGRGEPKLKIIDSIKSKKVIASLNLSDTYHVTPNTLDYSPDEKFLAFSPDGKFLAYPQNGGIIIRSLTSKNIVTLTGNDEAINKIAFSPDGIYFAGASSGNDIIFWDIQSALEGGASKDLEPIGRINIKGLFGLSNLEFSNNGKKILISSENKIRVYSLNNLNEGYMPESFESFDGDEAIFMPTTNAIIYSQKNNLFFRNLADSLGGDFIKLAHDSITTSAFFTNNENTIISNSDGNIYFIDTISRKVQSLIKNDEVVVTMEISDDKSMFASGTVDGEIKLWDMNNNQIINSHNEHSSKIIDIAISKNNEIIASSSHDQTLRLWNTATNKILKLDEGKTFYRLDFSSDGTLLASASETGTVDLWNALTGEFVDKLKISSKKVYSVKFSPNNKLLITWSNDGIIEVWDIKEKQRITSFLNGRDDDFISQFVFSNDSKLLFVTSKTGLDVWDLPQEKRIYSKNIYKEYDTTPINNIQLSADENQLLLASVTGLFLLNISSLNQTQNTEKIVNTFESSSLLQLEKLKIKSSNSPNLFFRNKPIKPNLNYPKTHPFHWLSLAEKGDANAMLQLGIIAHRNSHWGKAKEWYEKARNAGNPNAEERLRVLALTKENAAQRD